MSGFEYFTCWCIYELMTWLFEMYAIYPLWWFIVEIFMHVVLENLFEDVTSISWIFIIFMCLIALIEVGRYNFCLQPCTNGAYRSAWGAWPCANGAHGCPCVRNLAFLFRFRSFFCLETPKNLKWIFFTLYHLQQLSKNHWSSSFISLILHMMSLSIYIISHYKTPMELNDLW